MFEVEKLKQQVYKQVQDSGMYKQMQAQLKTQVLTTLETQSSSKQSALHFSYEHPLLSKLQKHNLTHTCLDLIQEFLESFKFQYTLSVFMKQVNRDSKINRDKLAKQINLESNQAVLLTAVEVLRNGEVAKKKESGYLGNPDNLRKQFKPEVTTKNPEKEFPKTAKDFHDSKESKHKDDFIQKQKQKPKDKQIQKEKPVSPSPSPPPHVKPKKQQPKTAADFLGSITSKLVPKQQPKKPIYERAMSAPAAPIKTAPPPETGANKIRGGITTGKPSPISALLKGTSIGANKDPYTYDLKSKPAPSFKKKSQEDIDQQIDQFQQSRDSTRRNPLFSSTEQGLQSMGYDQSVDSIAIEQYDHYQIAKKKRK